MHNERGNCIKENMKSFGLPERMFRSENNGEWESGRQPAHPGQFMAIKDINTATRVNTTTHIQFILALKYH